MSVEACATLVAEAAPGRFRAILAAPLDARPRLLVLHAFNLEVARAPWAASEPMIAEMRLQFWRDVLEGIAQSHPPRAHEVAAPLAAMIPPEDAVLLDEMVALRRWDIYRDPFEDEAHFDAYIGATSGHLAWVAARGAGAPDGAEAAIRDMAWAGGLAAFLQAVPELEARGRVPLIDGRAPAVVALAREGLARWRRGRAGQGALAPNARAALYPHWQAGRILSKAAQTPALVAGGGLGQSGFRTGFSLLNLAWRGRL